MLRHIILGVFITFATTVNAQYTESINSNRPGVSYGAYAVGADVIQGEMGFRVGNKEHVLLQQESDVFDLDYSLRYGLLLERLEVILDGTYGSESTIIPRGASAENFTSKNFRRNTLGAKYLIYDRNLKKDLEGPNIRSWKAENTLQWNDLIPSISAYVGSNILFGDNPFLPPNEPSLSPRAAIITQNNYKNWVLVTNFIADRITSDFPSYEGIFTLTHTLNENLAVFTEFQFIVSDYYSDELLRMGVGYLATDDIQIDGAILLNFKDTPSIWNFGLGISYRYDDLHQGRRMFKNKADRKDARRKKSLGN
jgi:hypothetical protein